MKVSIPHALRLGQRLLAAQGVPDDIAAAVADHLVGADQAWYLRETAAYIDYLVTCPPQPGVDAVQYPGEYEALSRQANADSVAYEGKNWDGLVQAATELGVADALPE